MGKFVFAAWIATACLSWTLLGPHLGQLIEGYDSRQLAKGPLLVVALATLGSLVATIVWARRLRSAGTSQPASAGRRFLLGSLGTAGGLAAALGAAIAPNSRWYSTTGKNIFLPQPPYKADRYETDWAGTRIAAYRRLGRTEAMVSDISIGTGSSSGGRMTPAVAREAIERGMNYFDTAPDYSETGSETVLAEAMKGYRDQIFLATKFCTTSGHLGPGTSVADYMAAVDGSLQRLQTDYVDLVHIHSCNTVERLLDENVHEAFDRLRDQGKVRFLGVSTHTPDLEPVAKAAIESDRFDVLMLAYHHGAWPSLQAIVDQAAENDIGVVAMKTLRGALHQGLDWSRAESESFTQASFKWVLANPSVSCLVISLWEQAQLDEFFYASGQPPTDHDVAVLDRYAELTQAVHCRPHCGICLDSCPENLAIADILRHKNYFESFGAQKEAMRLYAKLETKADVCLSCSAPCQSACPYEIPIAEHTRAADRLLRLT